MADAQKDGQSSEPSRENAASKGQPSREQSAKAQESHPFWDFWGPVIFTLALYFGIRHYVAEARFIPSESMLPGLQVDDRLIVEKLTYLARKPRRGEIVVFNSPHAFDPVLRSPTPPSSLQCALANIPVVGLIPALQDDACAAYIKRVVGIPGDQVVVNPRGEVILNGDPLKEDYVANYCPIDENGMSRCATLNVTVPDGHVLVLGDNRANSQDGRYWPGLKFVPESEIVGRASWRFWPFGRWGGLK